MMKEMVRTASVGWTVTNWMAEGLPSRRHGTHVINEAHLVPIKFLEPGSKEELCEVLESSALWSLALGAMLNGLI